MAVAFRIICRIKCFENSLEIVSCQVDTTEFSTASAKLPTENLSDFRIHYPCMSQRPRKKRDVPGQILLFPGAATESGLDAFESPDETVENPKRSSREFSTEPKSSVVICGSFRKDPSALSKLHEQFRDLRFKILSPQSVEVQREENGFVYMRGEESQTMETLERRHLDAVEKADFVWLHAPDGYVGLSASLEIGYATALGTPVYTSIALQDPVLQTMVRLIESPSTLMPTRLTAPPPVPKPAITRFQNYYRNVATQRGYEHESAQNCLMLMVEEIGELARGLRQRQNITRHHSSTSETLQELADVFIYVVHMANILDADLGQIVKDKETANWIRFLKKLHA